MTSVREVLILIGLCVAALVALVACDSASTAQATPMPPSPPAPVFKVLTVPQFTGTGYAPGYLAKWCDGTKLIYGTYDGAAGFGTNILPNDPECATGVLK